MAGFLRPPAEAWRRRADMNSLGLAVLLILIALLYSDAQSTSRDIQASRVQFARDSCRAQNVRHDDTISQLDAQIRMLPPRERRRAMSRRAGTVALIEALAPRRDCRALVEQIRTADD